MDFSFKKSEDVCVGDWIEFPNIYRNKILTSEQILSYWKPSDTRTDFKLNNNILLSKDFWWFIGMWLAEGWVINSYDNVYQIETAHNIKEKDIIFKMKNIINNLFDRQANLIEKKEDNCIKISFSSKELGIFLTSEFGKYAHGKKIPQWVKYLPDNLKMNLIEGYILGDGCWFSEERVNKNIVDLESKMSCVSVSLELLEGIQDILFSVGIMSCLGKLRDEKKTFIKKRESKQKITYSLSLSHYDSVDLANRLKWNHSYEIKNKRIIKDSFFSKDLSKIYFRVKKIIKKEYSGNVYNFETETHTYCTNRIVTHNCDVSRGDAKDYSAFHVFRMDTHPIRQVAEYKGKIKPDQLGLLLVSVGQVYNNATIAPENNSGWSGQAILKIEECRYPFLYFSRRRKPKEKEYTPVDPYYAMNRNDYLPGYSVTSANRSQMLAKMEQYVRMGDVEINSPRLLEEFKTFIVTETNRAEAMRGYNDDLIMALAGGLWVRDEAFLYSYRNDEIAKSMLDGMSTSKTPITQYSDFNHNTNFFDRGRIIEHVNDQNKIKLGDGSEESLLWLIKG